MGIQFKHILLSLFAFTAFVSLAVGIEYKDLTFDEAVKQSKEVNKPLFLDFYTDWCSVCKKLDQTTLRDAKLVNYINSNFIPLKIDAEDVSGKDIAALFSVSSFPTIIFYNPMHDLTERVKGLQSAEQYHTIGESVLDPESNELYKFRAEYEQGNKDSEFVYSYIQALEERLIDAKHIAREYIQKHEVDINDETQLKIMLTAKLDEDNDLMQRLIIEFDPKNEIHTNIFKDLSLRVYNTSFLERDVQLIRDFADRNAKMFERLTGKIMTTQDIINYLADLHKVLII